MVTIKFKIKSGKGPTKFVERMSDGTVKIQVSAPKEKGKANYELLSYLKSKTGIKNIHIICGEFSPEKTISFDLSSVDEVLKKLSS